MKTRMYIDGFNLYHRLLRGQGPGYKWIDFSSLGEHITGNQIDLARYFTANIRKHKGISQSSFNVKRTNQEALLNAYRKVHNVELHLGLFQLRDKSGLPVNKKTRKPLGPCSGLPTWFRNCIASHESMTVQSFEEKKTDVNIATYLLKDAYEGNVDVAVVISNDSDLCEPLRICKEELGIFVIAINPITIKMKKHSRFNQLAAVANKTYELRPNIISKFQMEPIFQTVT